MIDDMPEIALLATDGDEDLATSAFGSRRDLASDEARTVCGSREQPVGFRMEGRRSNVDASSRFAPQLKHAPCSNDLIT